MDISSVASRSVATATGSGTREYVQSTPVASGSVAPKVATRGKDVATQAPSPERVAQAVKQVNDDFAQKGQNLNAVIERDKATGIYVVKVLDKNTGEVISQFPSKEIIAIAEGIDQFQASKGRLIRVSA